MSIILDRAVESSVGKTSPLIPPSRLLRDFNKLKVSLQSQNKPETQLLRDIFQKNENIVMLQKEKRLNVHAEAQMLAYLFNFREKLKNPDLTLLAENYIGIAKLCCFHCQVLLEKINEILKLNIKARGEHNMTAKGGWISPFVFSEGYNATIDLGGEKSEAFLIGQAVKKITNQTQPNSNKGDQYADESSSEVSEENIQIRIAEARIAGLKNLINLTTDRELIAMTNIALQLHESQAFQDFLEKNLNELMSIDVFRELHENFEEVPDELFLKILQNSLFLGEMISEYFKDFKLGLTQGLITSSSVEPNLFIKVVESEPKERSDKKDSGVRVLRLLRHSPEQQMQMDEMSKNEEMDDVFEMEQSKKRGRSSVEAMSKEEEEHFSRARKTKENIYRN